MKTLLAIFSVAFLLLMGCDRHNCSEHQKQYKEVVLRGVILDYERVANRNARFGVHTEIKFQDEDSCIVNFNFTGLIGVIAKGVPVQLSFLDDLWSECDSFRDLKFIGPDSACIRVYPDSLVVSGTIWGIYEYIHEAGSHSTVTHTTIMYDNTLSVVVYWDREREIRHLIGKESALTMINNGLWPCSLLSFRLVKNPTEEIKVKLESFHQ